MAHDVFISHSSKDKAIADAICHALEENGVRCWIAPRDELAGAKYIVQIDNAIEECTVFLLVFSANANSSEDVISEVQMALDKAKTVIPFRTEDVPMSVELEYLLKRVHWLDAYPDKNAFDNLVDHVKRNLDRPVDDTAIISPVPSPPGKIHDEPEGRVASEPPKIPTHSTKSQSPSLNPQDFKPAMKLKGMLLSGTSFAGANLKGTTFARSSLIGCDFRGACLTRTDFSNSNLEEADLSEVDLKDSRLAWANMQRATLIRANLEWVRISRADLTDAVLDDANLNMVDARDACMVDASAKRAIFTSALLNDTDCRGVDFTEADFADAVLEGAQLQGANFTGAKNLTAEQIRSADIDDSTVLDSYLAEKI